MILKILSLFVLALLYPTSSWAWGIGAHLQFGAEILNALHTLPEATAAILRAWPHDFLYGCISADITLAKKHTHHSKHCHSWRMGKKILAAAKNDAQRACGYGYLAHLAADSVAHCYFVPFKLVRTFNTNIHRHAYWEMRFESRVPDDIWVLANNMARRKFRQHDAMMRMVLSDTIFSFKTNKQLFNSLLLLNRLQQWKKVLRAMEASSRLRINDVDHDEYLTHSVQAIFSILREGDESPFYKADPTGERALAAAAALRKNLNHLWLEGKLSNEDATLILDGLKIQFRNGVLDPDEMLDLIATS
jgi:hypothetical protein